MKTSTTEKIRNRIKRYPKGKLFILNDFIDIADRDTAKVEINKLVKENILRRVYNGIYLKPRINKRLNMEVPPSHYDIVKQIARKNNQQITPYGNTALNLAGLSTQVPATLEYATDGPSRTIQLTPGPVVNFKHVGKKSFFENNDSNFTINIIAYLSNNDINNLTLKALAGRLDQQAYDNLVKVSNKLTTKTRNYIIQIGSYIND